MSTCWWSNNIIIAWTRKLIEFLFNIFIQRTFHCITISIRPEKERKIIQAKEEISIQETQESRKKNEFLLFTIEMYWRLDKKS